MIFFRIINKCHRSFVVYLYNEEEEEERIYFDGDDDKDLSSSADK